MSNDKWKMAIPCVPYFLPTTTVFCLSLGHLQQNEAAGRRPGPQHRRHFRLHHRSHSPLGF